MFKPTNKRFSIPIPPGVDSVEVSIEDSGKIIISPVNQEKSKKKTLTSMQGILDGAFYKKYGKSPAQVIRDSRNED